MQNKASTPRQENMILLTIWTGSTIFSCHSGQGRINKVCWQHCTWQSHFAVLSGTDGEPLLCSSGTLIHSEDELWQQCVTKNPSHIHSLTYSVKIVSYEWLQEICGHWLLIDLIFSLLNLTGSEDTCNVEKKAIKYVQNALVLFP